MPRGCACGVQAASALRSWQIQELELNTLNCLRLALLLMLFPVLARPADLAVPGPDRLPPDTWVLVNWHGVSGASQVKDTNPVMKLWNDPQFAAAREQIITKVAGSVGKDAGTDGRAEVDDVISVLGNPAVLGVAGDPLARGADTVHVFVVLNRKGKEAEWSRLHAKRKVGTNAQVSRYTFRGVQIRKRTTTKSGAPAPAGKSPPPTVQKVSHSLEASLGDYELYSDNQALMESLVTRLKDAAPASDSLLKDAAYQRAQRFRAERPMLEAFVKVPDLSKAPLPPSPQMNTETTLRELHPERLQGVWLSAGMGRDRMLVRGALLGDMSPGSMLDLIGANAATFRTLAMAPALESFSAVRLDLQAFYATVLRAVKAGMPPDRGAAASLMIDSMVVSQTGLRASELLALFTGELAVAANGDETSEPGALPAAVLIPLADGEQVLTVLRKLAAGAFARQKKIFGATVVEFDTGTVAAINGRPARRDPLLLAVAQDMLVISSNDVEMNKLLARNASAEASPAGSLAADASFITARRQLPAELNSISYTDFSRMNWEPRVQALNRKLADQKERLLERARKAEDGDGDIAPDTQLAARLRQQSEDLGGIERIFIEILPLAQKHLKVSIGGSWKSADGVFFDSFVN
jgi:hypothetical protein